MILYMKDSYRVFKRSSPASWNQKDVVNYPTRNSYSMPKMKENPIEQELPAYEWQKFLIHTQTIESYILSNQVRPMDDPFRMINSFYVFNDRSIPTNEIPSTVDTPNYQPLCYVGNHIRRQQSLRPKQLAAQDRDTIANHPGWIEPRKHVICYQGYEIEDYISPECSAKANDMDLVVRNY